MELGEDGRRWIKLSGGGWSRVEVGVQFSNTESEKCHSF